MIKRITVYSLPESLDFEKFWQYQIEGHGAHVMEAAGSKLKSYVLNRVDRVQFGDKKISGYVEQYFENEQDVDEFVEILRNARNIDGKTMYEDWSEKAKPNWVASYTLLEKRLK